MGTPTVTPRCVGHTFTAQGREHRLAVDGDLMWVNEHAGLPKLTLLAASGCSLTPRWITDAYGDHR